jgi:hypothetical protein
VQDDEVLLDAVNDNPSSSTRSIASWTGLSQSAVWRVLRESSLHPFHLKPVQGLQPGDKERRLEYCRWLLHRVVDEPDFLNRVLWTDEAGFTRDGVMNLHNLHVWAAENPRPTRSSSFQHRFSVNFWAGIVDDHLIGPYVNRSHRWCPITQFPARNTSYFNGRFTPQYTSGHVVLAWRCTGPLHTSSAWLIKS